MKDRVTKQWLKPRLKVLNTSTVQSGTAYYTGAEYYRTYTCVGTICSLTNSFGFGSGANYPLPGPTSVSGPCTTGSGNVACAS